MPDIPEIELSPTIRKLKKFLPPPLVDLDYVVVNDATGEVGFRWTKDGEPEAYTWLRVGIWEPAAFQVPKLVKGAFIAGSGDMTLRSYEGKDGKASSLECRATSFDVEVSDGSARNGPVEHHAAKPYASPANLAGDAPSKPTRSTPTDDEPPF